MWTLSTTLWRYGPSSPLCSSLFAITFHSEDSSTKFVTIILFYIRFYSYDFCEFYIYVPCNFELTSPIGGAKRLVSRRVRRSRPTVQRSLWSVMQHPPTQTRSEDIDPDKDFCYHSFQNLRKWMTTKTFKIAVMQSVKNILNPPIDNLQLSTQTFTNSIILTILASKLLSRIHLPNPAICNSII